MTVSTPTQTVVFYACRFKEGYLCKAPSGSQPSMRQFVGEEDPVPVCLAPMNSSMNELDITNMCSVSEPKIIQTVEVSAQS